MRVITLGTFDLLHSGHIKLFKRCRELAGKSEVIVGLNTDTFIYNYKGKLPIMSYDERKEMIEEIDIVDLVIPNDQTAKGSSSLKTILECGANLIVIGSDWLSKDYLGQLGISIKDLEANSLSLCYVPYTKNISTSEIKRRFYD